MANTKNKAQQNKNQQAKKSLSIATNLPKDGGATPKASGGGAPGVLAGSQSTAGARTAAIAMAPQTPPRGPLADQLRAAYALEVIGRREQAFSEAKRARDTSPNDRGVRDDYERVRGRTSTYASRVRGLPAMVLQNGLGQALAYLLADSENDAAKPSRWLYGELQKWLCTSDAPTQPGRVFSSSDLMRAVITDDRDHYHRAQREALTLLAWMRKFTDAYLSDPDLAKGGER